MDSHPVPPALTPSAPPPPPRFTLPLAAWLAWALYGLALLVLALRAPGGLSSYEIGRLTGNIVGVLILPTLFAWLAWRLFRRSQVARTVTFFTLFGLLVLSGLLRATRHASQQNAFANLDDLARENREVQRAALARDGTLNPAESEKFARAVTSELQKATASSTGQTRAAAEAGQAIMERLLAINTRYKAALAEIEVATFFRFSSLDTPEKIAARRKAVQDFAAANAEMEQRQANGLELLRAELEQRGVSGTMLNSTLQGYTESSRTQIPIILKIRDTDARLATAMLDFLDLAEGKLGKWELRSNGEIAFENPTAKIRYDALLEQVQTVSAEQREYQRQLVEHSAPPRPTPAR